MHQYIVDTLTPLGIEIAWSSYTGDAGHYLIFSIYQEEETEACDDQYLFERFYLTISYWFKAPEYLENKNKIKRCLLNAGFVFDGAKDLYDNGKHGINFDFIYERRKDEVVCQKLKN